MRIAIWHNLPSGGGKRALYGQIKGLLGRGHYIEAWSPTSADHSYLPLNSLIQEHVLPVQLPATDRGGSGVIGYLRTRWSQPIVRKEMHKHAAEVVGQIASKGFDVLLAHPCRFFLAPHIGRYAQIPKLLYLQEPNRVLYEAMPDLKWVSPPHGRGLPNGVASSSLLSRSLDSIRAHLRFAILRSLACEEIVNARAFDRILVNSFYSAESVRRAYGLDADVCYLGVDESMFRQMNLPKENFVVGLGSLHWTKGVDLVVDAIANVTNRRPRLVWICNSADPEYRKAVCRRAADGGVDLEIKENIPDSEIVGLLNRATAMIYAPRLEPFGFAPLEANLCGTPVIAVPEGGVRETVKNDVNGCLVPPDPKAIARCIERLLGDRAFAQDLGNRARIYAQTEWSLARSISALEERLQGVQADRSSNR
jgi:glycosyltransferase involved in cell wall biosynthesis